MKTSGTIQYRTRNGRVEQVNGKFLVIVTKIVNGKKQDLTVGTYSRSELQKAINHCNSSDMSFILL